MFFTLLQSNAAGGAAGSQSIMTVLPFVLLIAIFYFFIIRPQNKKQKETQKMIDALKKGDKVVTIGGIHGTISATKEKTVIVKVDDSTKIEFNRSAIAGVNIDKPVAKDDKKADKKNDKKAEEVKADAVADNVQQNADSSENAENK